MASIGFTAGTIVGMMLIPVVLLANIKRAYQITFFSMIFTRMAFVNIGNESIMLYHVLSLMVIVRYYLSSLQIKFRIPKTLLYFTLYSGISIVFALFSEDAYVISVDNVYTNVMFSFQQFTQFAYLLYGVIFMVFTSNLLVEKHITVDTILEVLDFSYFCTAILGFLQLIVPLEQFNLLFKNSMVGYSQQIMDGRYRIDATFGEASMLMVFMTPVFCRHLYKILFDKFSVKSLCVVILGTLIVFENRSSSFVIGVAAMILLFGIFMISENVIGKKIVKKTSVVKIFMGILVVGIALLMFHQQVFKVVDTFLVKLREGNVSGTQRFYAARLHMQVFAQHLLLGVGFGTLRSYDLLTGWLAQGGVIGFGLYAYAIVKVGQVLMKHRTVYAKEVLILIVVYNVIMMASVPEFGYVYPWVFYTMGYEVVYVNKVKNDRDKFICEKR